MDATEAYATPAGDTARQMFPVATADTSLPATFAWLAEPVSSSPVARTGIEAIRPVPDIAPALRRFRGVLNRLAPQADEGDLAGLSEEIASWSPDRARATWPLADD